ncbi:hypothetical protein [Streptomyces sp. NPDC002580]|uniref:hypothetical protein n=1 Tax=Streptomyces sp. NPDC002580 TaxID=3364653 RepID=UPI00367E05A0
MEGGEGGFVEFENRHGTVWRVEWHGAWFIAERETPDGWPREIEGDELLSFARTRLTEQPAPPPRHLVGLPGARPSLQATRLRA